VEVELVVNGRARRVTVTRAESPANVFDVEIDGERWRVDAERIGAHTLSLLLGGVSREVTVTPDPAAAGQLIVRAGASIVPVTANGRRRFGASHDAAASAGPQRVVAPMPGKIVRVLVGPGEAVAARQPLVVVEAMKMENELRAARNGSVAAVHVQEGQPVDAGALLVVVE
jgi:biotin carboxyl carrier protein